MLDHKFIVTVAQLNPTTGDLLNNTRKIHETYLEADDRGVDLVVTPELSLTGGPLGGLAGNPDFLDAAGAALDVLRLATRDRDACLLVGLPLRSGDDTESAAVLLRRGQVQATVFDRRSVAEAGGLADIGGVNLGLMVGSAAGRSAVAKRLRAAGADVVVSVNAAPYSPRDRMPDRAAACAVGIGAPLLYVNSFGGQGDTVCGGGSFYMDASGGRLMQLPHWEECDMDCDLSGLHATVEEDGDADDLENIYRAMTVGLGDYVRKSGFSDVVLGLSGGMDSALVAAVAGDALGAEHVHCVRLPSRYTADLSNTAAEDMCRAWGFDMHTLPIGELVAAGSGILTAMFPDGLKKLTTENMQARARGYLLMTVSNDRGWLLLSTGNKSEISVGYATLYGDMCGAYNPIKDVFKTTVFALARWRNANCPQGLLGPAGVVIPPAIIEREPSAELSPGQRDTDSLPPYATLDAILGEMLERNAGDGDIVALGHDRQLVERVRRMVKRAEYKRRQGAPGVRFSPGGVCPDDRLPLINGFEPDTGARLRAVIDKM